MCRADVTEITHTRVFGGRAASRKNVALYDDVVLEYASQGRVVATGSVYANRYISCSRSPFARSGAGVTTSTLYTGTAPDIESTRANPAWDGRTLPKPVVAVTS